MSALTHGKILQACHEACGQTALERGRASVSRGEVIRYRWDAGRKRLHGEVASEAGDAFEVSIEIAIDRRGLRMEGDCSCAEGYNCLHVAALTIEWLRQRESGGKPASALAAWRAALRRHHPRTASRSASDPAECLLYRVSLSAGRATPRLDVEVSRVRRLRKGGFGKPARISPAEFSSYRLREILDAHDEYILALLQGIREGTGSRNRVVLDGELGALVFRRMVESGRCFVAGRDAGPLKPGPDRRPSLVWESAEAGLQLVCVVPGIEGEWLLTPTDPGYYVDMDSGESGRIEGGLSGALLAELRQLPALGRDDAEQIARDLVTDEALGALPSPVELDIRTLDAEGPMPRLTVLGHGPGDSRFSARLESVYGGYPVPHVMADAREKLVVEDCAGRPDALVCRDVAAELEAIDILGNQGMKLRREGTDLMLLAPGEGDTESAFWAEFGSRGRTALEALGWEVRFGGDFTLRVLEPERWSLSPQTDHFAARDENDIDWFSVSLEVDVDGHVLPVLPIILEWLEQGGNDPADLDGKRDLLVPMDDRNWIRIPARLLRPVVGTLLELVEGAGDDDPTLHQAIPEWRSPLLLDLERELQSEGAEIGRWSIPEPVRDIAAKLLGFNGIRRVEPPAGLQGELREYQRTGLDWLHFLADCGLAGVLADDMGLGKTIQVLAHLLLEKSQGRLSGPSLVVMPTSLVSNWRRETKRFAPSLNLLVLHGNDRHARFADIPNNDLVITTYSLLPRDAERLREQAFEFVILDEAQWIRNPSTKAARTAFSLVARQRLCVTGTPLENHLGELWSQFHFLMPGFLGSQEAFKRRFRNPIEKQGDDMRRDALASRVRPFILRRTKDQVASELPEKVVMERLVTLEGPQAALYETVRATMEQRVRRAIRDSGISRSHITVLDALLKLRQVCCDPRLLKLPSAGQVRQSAKLEMLMQMLPELIEEGRRILVFSQFTSMLGLIEDELAARGISFSKLTGRTRNRESAIDAFQQGGASVFLVSLKAGGVGLNLTAADTVILYDPWWNPAVERQAIDRAHRIGQDKTVFVYRLIAENTIEEKIRALQQRKQLLAESIFEQREDLADVFDADALLALFSPSEVA